MSTDAITHMEEAWRLDDNPFPAEAINQENSPYCPTVFEEETQEFRRKFVRGCLGGSVNIGFLWSQGTHADTGFGKTTLMREIAKEINRDLGLNTLTKAGLRQERLEPIAAAYSSLNNLNASGLYPVLFNAVLDLAKHVPESEPGLDPTEAVLDQVRSRIIEKLRSGNPDQIANHIRETWLRICGTAPPLRTEVVQAFAQEGASGVRATLGEVSATARLRNGLHYLDFVLAALSSAEVEHLYLMIDQLEDLATTRTITAAKRSREIGRIRDMLEGPPYVNRIHFVLTFHNRAAQVLERFWQENRLPPYEISPRNTGSVVILRGLENDDQVADLLRVYLAVHRTDPTTNDLMPFDTEAVAILRSVSDGRVGILLNRARELFNLAAVRGVPRITGEFTEKFFSGDESPDTDSDQELLETATEEDIDDLLLGPR